MNGDVVMKKQHSTANFVAPFLHHDRTQSFNVWCIRRTIDRGSTWQILSEQNTRGEKRDSRSAYSSDTPLVLFLYSSCTPPVLLLYSACSYYTSYSGILESRFSPLGRTPSLSHKIIIIIFPVDLSWRNRVGVCSPSLFQTLTSSWLRES